MTETAPGSPAEDFLALVDAREGHFGLESGHHGELWLGLDGLFAEPRRVAPLVERLGLALRRYDVAAVCGPLVGGAFLAQSVARSLNVGFAFTERITPQGGEGLYRARYRLPPALAPRVRGRRVAIVDDVMSAGSAARCTYEELRAHGAIPAAVGALLVLGSLGSEFFAGRDVPVVAVGSRPYRAWDPAACPLCVSGVPLEPVARPGAVLETARLSLRELTVEDAAFMRALLNEPSWLRFIGDRGVRTVDDAREYLLRGPIESYQRHGFGMYLVERKGDAAPIGICGLVKRDALEDVDVGFALFPAFWGSGYAYEAASAVVRFAKNALGLRRIIAVTAPDNAGSIRVLEKLGMTFEKMVRLSADDVEICQYANGREPDAVRKEAEQSS